MKKFFALGLSLILFAIPRADAHALLKDSTPARDATLKTAPAEVAVDFTEEVTPRFSGLTVEDSAGHRVDKGDVHPEGKAGARLGVNLLPLKPGIYVVRWHAVSADDGHKTQGSYHFTLTPGG